MKKFLLIFCLFGFFSGTLLFGMNFADEDGVEEIDGPSPYACEVELDEEELNQGLSSEETESSVWDDVGLSRRERIVCIPVSKKTKNCCAAWGCISPAACIPLGLVCLGGMAGLAIWGSMERANRLSAEQGLMLAEVAQDERGRDVELTCLLQDDQVSHFSLDGELGPSCEKCRYLATLATGENAEDYSPASMSVMFESNEDVFMTMGDGVPEFPVCELPPSSLDDPDCIDAFAEGNTRCGRLCVGEDEQGSMTQEVMVIVRDDTPDDGECRNPTTKTARVCVACERGYRYKSKCKNFVEYFQQKCCCDTDTAFVCHNYDWKTISGCADNPGDHDRLWDELINGGVCSGTDGPVREFKDAECPVGYEEVDYCYV